MYATDLTPEEQEHVRTALRFLRARVGGSWAPIAKALRFQAIHLSHVVSGRPVSASMAVRVARLAAVGVDDLFAGRFPPPGTCPHCGHHSEEVHAS